MRVIMSTLAFVVYLVVGMATVHAGPTPPLGSNSITLVTPDPALGVTVRFAVTAVKGVKDVRIMVMCRQDINGKTVLMYAESLPWDGAFLLGGTDHLWLVSWPYLSAHCEAILHYWTFRHGESPTLHQLASTTFEAAALY